MFKYIYFVRNTSLNKKDRQIQSFGGLAVFQSLRMRSEIHDFASPPRGGFAFSK